MAVAMAPMADILNNKTNKLHISIDIIASGHEKAAMIPKEVATPFPPLNFNHMGNMCPITTETAL